MHYLYVLESLKCKRRYIGIAANTIKRLAEHNASKISSTKAYIPWRIVWVESFSNKFTAAARERELKKNAWKRYDLYEKIKQGPIV